MTVTDELIEEVLRRLAKEIGPKKILNLLINSGSQFEVALMVTGDLRIKSSIDEILEAVVRESNTFTEKMEEHKEQLENNHWIKR